MQTKTGSEWKAQFNDVFSLFYHVSVFAFTIQFEKGIVAHPCPSFLINCLTVKLLTKDFGTLFSYL